MNSVFLRQITYRCKNALYSEKGASAQLIGTQSLSTKYREIENFWIFFSNTIWKRAKERTIVTTLRNKILPALSVRKGCHKDEPVSPKATTVIVSTHKGDPVSPWRNSGRKQRIPAIYQAPDCSQTQGWALRKLRLWKLRILAPESWGTSLKNDFNEPRLLSLPIYRKVLNSLT